MDEGEGLLGLRCERLSRFRSLVFLVFDLWSLVFGLQSLWSLILSLLASVFFSNFKVLHFFKGLEVD